MGKYTFGFGRN